MQKWLKHLAPVWVKTADSNSIIHPFSSEKMGANSFMPKVPPINPISSGMPGATTPTPQNAQLPPNNRRPSVVAQLGKEKGGLPGIQAKIQDLFNPQPQQQTIIRPPGQVKTSALHALGDPLPKDWNMTLVPPSKQNGGTPSFGQEAWESMNYARRTGSDKKNFDKSWHTAKGKKNAKE